MSVARRAEVHAALGDPARLAVIDELRATDRSPGELADLLGLAPNLLAFHLDVLERVGLVDRIVSSGDRRRRYIRVRPAAIDLIGFGRRPHPRSVVFVCTRNSARSQLAAAVWRSTGASATSAGTDPADAVAPGAVAAARRAGLDLGAARPQVFDDRHAARHVITVCDRAHEQLDRRVESWHWSIPDPVDSGTDADFDLALDLIRTRVAAVATTVRPVLTPTPPPQELP